MKTIRGHSAIVATFLLFSHPALAQSGDTFDLQAYQSFLAAHQDLSAGELRQMYPSATFRSRVEVNLNNVAYLDSIQEKYQLTPDELSLLSAHGIVVSERLSRDDFGHALLEIYTNDLPVFVSVDAILHALHRSYDAILQDTELAILIPRLKSLLTALHQHWAELARIYPQTEMQPMLNDFDVYITVALRLLGEEVAPANAQNQSAIAEILALIAAEQPAFYALFSSAPRDLDFCQFRPRGHYTEMESMRQYFRAMIWLGRTELMLTKPKSQDVSKPSDEDIQRQTILSYLLLEATINSNALAVWQEMDGIIAFLVGESDNVTLAHLQLLADEINLAQASELLNMARLAELQNALAAKAYAIQRINSQILYSDPMGPEQAAPPSAFLLLGQRFIIDSYVFGNVVYDRILYQGRKVMRMMPSSLDALFALGNDATAVLLNDELERYPYASNLAALRFLVDSYGDEFWNGSLYNVWLEAIRRLNPPDEIARFPAFMQTAAYWQQKINSQLAAWAQLRHDNLLYAKQSYTVGITCDYPHSFVEPFPDFYRAVGSFAAEAQRRFSTVNFEDNYTKGSILRFFATMAGVMDTLAAVAEKQLAKEEFDAAQTKFLKSMLYESNSCGPKFTGWYPDLFFRVGDDCAMKDYVVADVHTQPSDEVGNPVGYVLHVGTGPINLGVIIADRSDGTPTAFIGPVMSYYEHVTKDFLRLTDEEWRNLYNQAPSFRPAWVNAYLADANGNHRGPGPSLMTSVEDRKPQAVLPSTVMLHQNRPNPFNAGTLIRFEIPSQLANEDAHLAIYNVRGEMVRTLVNERLPGGNYFVRWEGNNDAGAGVASGVYLYRLQVGKMQEVRKLSMVK